MNTSKEESFLNQKKIYDITPFTTTDYPQYLSCILWFSGCNMRCVYCYNSDIVLNEKCNYSLNDALDFLNKRKGLLDGVVLSGGEALGHNLFELCTIIKAMGYKIKLDTNGLNTQSLQRLVLHNLVDFVALDYKAHEKKFFEITKSNQYHAFEESLLFLLQREIDFEVRTTVHADLLDVTDINEMIDNLYSWGYNKNYYLQEFIYTNTHLSAIKEPQNYLDKEQLSEKLNVVFR